LPEFVTNKGADFVKFKTNIVLENNKKVVFDHTIMLNRTAVKEIIKNNYYIYQKRLGLNKKVTVDEIYEVLKKGETFKKCQTDAPDIIGLTLGYPRDSSLLFSLTQTDKWKIRRNLEEEKQNLKYILRSENSPYKSFSKKFQTHMLNQVNKMALAFSSEFLNQGCNSYVFNALVQEPKAFQKILANFRIAINKLKRMNEKG
jgi:hypothetical protein